MNRVIKIENVAASTRVRLARNLAGYPFPARLTQEQALEIILLVNKAAASADDFTLYCMKDVKENLAYSLRERYLISQELIDHADISAALVSKDESISVMINEEDHIRAQYITKGLNINKAYEIVSGLDDILSEALSYAYEDTLGFLTACPTNLGTGLRASVMLFLPALTRGGYIESIAAELKRKGLTVRGAFGEGSLASGALYQVSNEVTLGWSEEEIISLVEREVMSVVELELKLREELQKARDVELIDGIMRSYGILTNCVRIGAQEFLKRMEDVKFGIALGVLEGDMQELDDLMIQLRPANIGRINGAPLGREEDTYRAEYAGRSLRKNLVADRNHLMGGR